MISRSTLIRMAEAEPSTARAGREIDHEADGKDAKGESSSFIDSGINHFENEIIPVLYEWSMGVRPPHASVGGCSLCVALFAIAGAS